MRAWLLVLLACGAAPAATVAEELPRYHGRYAAYFTLTETEGTCAWVEDSLYLEFDDAGQVQAPWPGVGCVTQYTATEVRLACKLGGNLLEVSGAGDEWVTKGQGTFRGSLGGCTRAAFTFRMYPSPK